MDGHHTMIFAASSTVGFRSSAEAFDVALFGSAPLRGKHQDIATSKAVA